MQHHLPDNHPMTLFLSSISSLPYSVPLTKIASLVKENHTKDDAYMGKYMDRAFAAFSDFEDAHRKGANNLIDALRVMMREEIRIFFSNIKKVDFTDGTESTNMEAITEPLMENINHFGEMELRSFDRSLVKSSKFSTRVRGYRSRLFKEIVGQRLDDDLDDLLEIFKDLHKIEKGVHELGAFRAETQKMELEDNFYSEHGYYPNTNLNRKDDMAHPTTSIQPDHLLRLPSIIDLTADNIPITTQLSKFRLAALPHYPSLPEPIFAPIVHPRPPHEDSKSRRKNSTASIMSTNHVLHNSEPQPTPCEVADASLAELRNMITSRYCIPDEEINSYITARDPSPGIRERKARSRRARGIDAIESQKFSIKGQSSLDMARIETRVLKHNNDKDDSEQQPPKKKRKSCVGTRTSEDGQDTDMSMI